MAVSPNDVLRSCQMRSNIYNNKNAKTEYKMVGLIPKSFNEATNNKLTVKRIQIIAQRKQTINTNINCNSKFHYR